MEIIQKDGKNYIGENGQLFLHQPIDASGRFLDTYQFPDNLVSGVFSLLFLYLVYLVVFFFPLMLLIRYIFIPIKKFIEIVLFNRITFLANDRK